MNASFHFAITSTEVAVNRVSDSWAWYDIRATGLLALGLLILLMFSGIGHVTGATYKFIPPVTAWSIHKAMAILLGIAIVMHCIGLLFDHYITFNLSQILVPFLKSYSNGTTIFGVGLDWIAIPAGIIAAYGAYVIIFSSLDTTGWIKRHKRLWKTTHIISYAVIILALIHALGSGTDFRESNWRTAVIIVGVLLVIGIILRLLRTRFLLGEQKR